MWHVASSCWTKCCQYHPPHQFLWTKIRSKCPITIAIDCNDLSLLIFEEKWPNNASGPKSAPNSDSFWVRRLFNVCMRVFSTPNATILLVYIPAKIKMSFIWKDDLFFFFFFAKISIFCKSIAGPLPSVVQGYTRPYSFGGRIKLIICQIRLELSVTIHEISSSWKKSVRWRTQYEGSKHGNLRKKCLFSVFMPCENVSPPQINKKLLSKSFIPNHWKSKSDLNREFCCRQDCSCYF